MMGATIRVGIKADQPAGWLTIALDTHSLAIDWQEAVRLVTMLTDTAVRAAMKTGVGPAGVHAAIEGALVEAEIQAGVRQPDPALAELDPEAGQ